MDAVNAERQAAADSIDLRLKAMRKAGAQAAAAATKAIPKGGGSALPATVRTRMEPQLGADLSQVRLHTSGESAETAGQLGARAFTVGSDVHFNSGEFAPGTKEGDRLIAHELTHVVQGQKSGVQRKPESGEEEHAGADVSQPGDPAEKEADAVGDHVADKLHGGKGEGAAETGDTKHAAQPHTEEKAPAIGAKLDGGGPKVHLARPARDPATPRPDQRAIPGSVATQQGVEIQVKPGALDHILKGHTVENFDPVARLGEIDPTTETSLFPPGFATNAQEIVTVVKQALGNKGARDFDPKARQLEVTLKNVNIEVWVGPVGKSAPGVFMLNSAFPSKGVALKYAEIKKYAADIQSRKKTLQQVRTELLGRFK